MMSRRCRLLAVALAALAGGVTSLSLRWSRLTDKPFDAVAWQDEATVEQGVRLEMADRLIAEGRLIGKTRAEVVAMLGEPTHTGHFANWDMVFWLGYERGYVSIDSEWLVLRLDSDNRIAENRIVRD